MTGPADAGPRELLDSVFAFSDAGEGARAFGDKHAPLWTGT
jgi:hypothetical protein